MDEFLLGLRFGFALLAGFAIGFWWLGLRSKELEFLFIAIFGMGGVLAVSYLMVGTGAFVFTGDGRMLTTLVEGILAFNHNQAVVATFSFAIAAGGTVRIMRG